MEDPLKKLFPSFDPKDDQGISPLSHLTTYFLEPRTAEAMASDKNTLLAEELARHEKNAQAITEIPGLKENQIDFLRAVSLRGVFVRAKEAIPKKITRKIENHFPKIGNFKNDDPDNIRFVPVLNLNLINLLSSAVEELSASLSKPLPSLEKEVSFLKTRQQILIEETKQTPAIVKEDRPENHLRKESAKPRISVISCSFNLARFVEETLRSVANQKGVDFEHIVIDGASKDETLDIVKKYPNIILLSEKDRGYPDALWKGIRMAKGDYVLQCAISDTYANEEWLKKCVELLDSRPEISLVWGFPGRLTEKSEMMGHIKGPMFHYSEAPEKEKMFDFWMKSLFPYPEGNLCARREVMLKCYPSYEDTKNTVMLDWLEFSYRFNRRGYLSAHIPVLANCGRSHDNQMGEELNKGGILRAMYKNYSTKANAYKWKVILGFKKHVFIMPDGTPTNIPFDRISFTKKRLIERVKIFFTINEKYFDPKKYSKYWKKRTKKH